MVPMATDNSRKISGAAEMIHLTVSMIAFPRCAAHRFDCRKLRESLIQINPRWV
jgi:hypothetical protein